LQDHQATLIVRQPGDRLGGIRSTSLLDEIIAFEAMFLFGLGAAVSLIRGFSLEGLKPKWIAAAAASAILCALCLKPLIDGYIWLPWL